MQETGDPNKGQPSRWWRDAPKTPAVQLPRPEQSRELWEWCLQETETGRIPLLSEHCQRGLMQLKVSLGFSQWQLCRKQANQAIMQWSAPRKMEILCWEEKRRRSGPLGTAVKSFYLVTALHVAKRSLSKVKIYLCWQDRRAKRWKEEGVGETGMDEGKLLSWCALLFSCLNHGNGFPKPKELYQWELFHYLS